MSGGGGEDGDARFARILGTFGPSLDRLAAAYEADPAERDDLLQDISFALWRALPAFRGECSERTFVYRIAHNRGLTHRARRKIRATEPLESCGRRARPRRDPEQALIRNLSRERLAAAVRRLPEGARQVVVLSLSGLSGRRDRRGAGDHREQCGRAPLPRAARRSRTCYDRNRRRVAAAGAGYGTSPTAGPMRGSRPCIARSSGQARRLRLVLAAELAAHRGCRWSSLVWVWQRVPGTRTGVIIAAALIHTAVIWGYALWNRSGHWKPVADTLRDAVRVRRAHFRRRLAAYRFVDLAGRGRSRAAGPGARDHGPHPVADPLLASPSSAEPCSGPSGTGSGSAASSTRWIASPWNSKRSER